MSCKERQKLRHRVTHQVTSQTRNSTGGFVQSWSDNAEFWALIEPRNGREYQLEDRNKADVTHTVKAVYRSGVSPKDRLVYNSRTFEIVYVINEDERSEWLIFECKEINPAATASVAWAD